MRSRLVGWEDVWAVVAIAVGLLTATTCWADGFTWHDPEGIHSTVGPQKCFVQANYCNTTSCHDWGDSGWTDWWFTCGNVVWLSFDVNQLHMRRDGICNNSDTATQPCTYYDHFYCIEYAVKSDRCLGGNVICTYQVWIGPACDPGPQ